MNLALLLLAMRWVHPSSSFQRIPRARPLQVEHQRQGADGRAHVVRGRLMLVDLAGSERAAAAAVGSTTHRQGAG